MTFEQLMMRYRFNISNASRDIGLTKQSIHRWKIKDRIPYSAQIKIEEATKGALKADASGVFGWRGSVESEHAESEAFCSESEKEISLLKSRIKKLESVIQILRELPFGNSSEEIKED